MSNLILWVVMVLPLFLIHFLVHKWFYTSSSTPKNRPPSPRKLPLIGNLHQVGFFPYKSLQILSRKYGPLMLLHIGNVPVLIVSSASVVREIIKTHDSVLSSRPKLSIPHKLFYGSKDIAFAPYGEYWRQGRSICVLHLLSNMRVQSFRNIREEETSIIIRHVEKLCSFSKLVNLSDIFILLTRDIVCRVTLGRKYTDGEMGRKFKLMLKGFSELLGTFSIGDYIPGLAWVNYFIGLDAKVNRVFKEIDEFLEGAIEEHKNKKFEVGGDSNLLDIMLEIQTKNVSSFDVENDRIKAIIWELLAAGNDATRTILDWALSELLRNPKIMCKLQDEVRQIVQGKSEICEDDLQKMHYLKAVIKETLRLHAPVPLVPRETTQDANMMGYDIKAGTQVFINAWAIGRDPSSWKNPEKFQPERFLNNTIDFKGFHCELIPFGTGRRGCPGMLFAVTINELALAKLVHKFDLTLPDGLRGEDLDMSQANGFNNQRKFPLIVSATPYNG